jgi:hypothetical protein
MTRLLLAAFALCLIACGQTSVGDTCTQDSDCDRGQTCYTTAPGGYCSKGCNVSGATTECPANTVCAQHNTQLLCSRTCQVQGDCREGYECNGVTNSSLKACALKKN